MRYFVILVAYGLLCSCAGYQERLKNGPYGGLFKTKAELEADDSAKCQGYGAQPGTYVYVQCMVGLAQVRATNAAARRAAAADDIRAPTPRRSMTVLPPHKPALTAMAGVV